MLRYQPEASATSLQYYRKKTLSLPLALTILRMLFTRSTPSCDHVFRSGLSAVPAVDEKFQLMFVKVNTSSSALDLVTKHIWGTQNLIGDTLFQGYTKHFQRSPTPSLLLMFSIIVSPGRPVRGMRGKRVWYKFLEVCIKPSAPGTIIITETAVKFMTTLMDYLPSLAVHSVFLVSQLTDNYHWPNTSCWSILTCVMDWLCQWIYSTVSVEIPLDWNFTFSA